MSTVETRPLAEWRKRHRSTLDETRYNVRVFFRDRLAVLGLAIILLTVAVAVFAPVVAPYPEQGRGKSNLENRFGAPSWKHPFGADRQGRDLLSRVIYGARIPLEVSILVVAGVVLIGVPLGGIAGYFGGLVDEVIMRITDIFLAFPFLILAISFVAFIGASLRSVMIALVISWWPWYTRLVRGLAVSLRQRPFVEAARTMGVKDGVIIMRHILPNTIGPVIVQMTLDVGLVVLAASGLSFLGMGAKAPTPEWGLMVAEGRQYIFDQWWYAAFPGLALFVLVLAWNLVGDGLRDVLDPRTKR